MPKKKLVVEGLVQAMARTGKAIDALQWVQGSKAVQDILDCGQPRQLGVKDGLSAAADILSRHMQDLKEELTWWEAWEEVQAREGF